jgi:hypothetical protein
MTQIRIEAVTGPTPISVYVADVYGNNQSLLRDNNKHGGNTTG